MAKADQSSTVSPDLSGSDHFDGTRFFNPGHDATDRTLSDIWRWRRTSHRAAWPGRVAVQPVRPERRVSGGRATMVGHSTVLLQVGGVNVLTDPVWSERASPFRFAGPRRVTAPGIAFDDLPPIDIVLLSHNHYDHCDLRTLQRLQARDRPHVVAPLGNEALLRGAMPDLRLSERDWNESVDLGEAGTVAVVPARHWSARSLRDRRRALWGGFVWNSPVARIYFVGDTGYGDGAIFPAIRERFGAPDLALIPIGAYEPRWFMAAQHVDPAEAVRIFQDVGAQRAIGIHWGCFQLTDEARDAPAERIGLALREAGIEAPRFAPGRPGEVFDFA